MITCFIEQSVPNAIPDPTSSANTGATHANSEIKISLGENLRTLNGRTACPCRESKAHRIYAIKSTLPDTSPVASLLFVLLSSRFSSRSIGRARFSISECFAMAGRYADAVDLPSAVIRLIRYGHPCGSAMTLPGRTRNPDAT